MNTDFVPEDWHVGYPNPAFSAMQESDGAWMARIISHLDDADIEAIVNEAQLSSPIARSRSTAYCRFARKRSSVSLEGRSKSSRAAAC